MNTGGTGLNGVGRGLADSSYVATADGSNFTWKGNPVNVGGTPYGLAVGRGTCVVPIGQRSHVGLDGTAINSTTSTSTTYRQFWPLSDPKAGSVLPVFLNPNWNGTISSDTGDVDATNAVTFACAVECSDGTVVPFTFNGSHTATLPAAAGAIIVPDAPIAFGTQVSVAGTNALPTMSGVNLRVYVSQSASRSDTVTTTSGSATVTDASITAGDQGRLVSGTGIPAGAVIGTVSAGVSFTLAIPKKTGLSSTNATASGTVTAVISSQWPNLYSTPITNNDTFNGNNGADVTTFGATFSSSGGSGQFGPVLLLGPAPSGRKPIVAQISDSIFNGTTDSTIGPVQRAAVALGLPFVKASKFGDFALAWATPQGIRGRMHLLPGCTHAVIELGTNDGIDTALKVTNLEGYLTTIGTWLTGLGMKCYLTTLGGHTTSTDGWATVAGQTLLWPAAQVAAFNSWVRGVPTPYSGYVEMGDVLLSARDSGAFAPHPTRGRRLTDAVTTSGTNVVTSASGAFTAADVGLGIYVAGAITNSFAVIAAVTDGQTVTVNNSATGSAFNASASVSGAVAGIGAYYATTDGLHPSQTLMRAGVATNVQTLMAAFTV